MACFLPPIQLLLETTPQATMARALQARAAQLLLETAPRTTHIHPTHLAGVRGRVESQVFWCNAHNIRVGAQMVELIVLQLM